MRRCPVKDRKTRGAVGLAQIALPATIFGGDHIYNMDARLMLDRHFDTEADLTVAVIPVPKAEARDFGVIHVDDAGKVIAFVEKPADPPEIPGRPGWSLASMGNYIFGRKVLEEELRADQYD